MRFEATIYFDGPRTKWIRSARDWAFEAHPGGLRIPRQQAGEPPMPAADSEEVLQREVFRFEWMARVWVMARLKGFDTAKIVGEVRPL